MRAIAQGAPPPTYMGGRLGRDTLPSRGLLLDGLWITWSCLPISRAERDQVPVCHGRTSADGSSSLTPSLHPRCWWRMHIRAGTEVMPRRANEAESAACAPAGT